MSKIHVSIVTPIFNEAENIPRLTRQIQDVMKVSGYTWELIAVDDGSTDESAKILQALTEDYPALKPVYLRRNYGQTAAMQAGFDAAKGDMVVTLDADLQNDPSDIPAMLAYMEQTGADIVSGWRKNRKDNTWKRNIPSKIANRLIGWVTGVKLHDYGCSLKVYTRDVLEDVKIYGELHRFIPAVASQHGAKVEEMVVKHHPRLFGTSKYGIDRTFRVVLDLILIKFILKYMNRPMHAFGYFGLLLLTPGMMIATYLTTLKLLMGEDIGGRPLLTLAVLLILMGTQLIGMGILGEMLMRIHHEPTGRKQYTLKPPKAVKKKKT